jgi:hypothetical protein
MFFPQNIKKLSVVQAMEFAQTRVRYVFLPLFFMAGGIVQVFCKGLPFFQALPLFIICFLVPCWYYALAVGRWRVWAFARVQDKRKLYNYAVGERLIPATNHWLFPAEMALSQKQKSWAKIQKELDAQPSELDPYDSGIPDIVEIRFAKTYWILGLIAFILIVGGYVVYNCLTAVNPTKKDRNLPWFMALGFVVFLPTLIRAVKRTFFLRDPQITFSPSGISTPAGNYSWSQIHQADFHTEGTGDSTVTYLRIWVLPPFNPIAATLKAEPEETLLNLESLEMQTIEMRHTLDVFKQRHCRKFN